MLQLLSDICCLPTGYVAVLVIFKFLSHSLNMKLRARWVSYEREEEGEQWQWLRATSESPAMNAALLGSITWFWLVSFYTSLIPSGSLIEASWKLVFMNVLWFYRVCFFQDYDSSITFTVMHKIYLQLMKKSTVWSRKNIKWMASKMEFVQLITNRYNSQ